MSQPSANDPEIWSSAPGVVHQSVIQWWNFQHDDDLDLFYFTHWKRNCLMFMSSLAASQQAGELNLYLFSGCCFQCGFSQAEPGWGEPPSWRAMLLWAVWSTLLLLIPLDAAQEEEDVRAGRDHHVALWSEETCCTSMGLCWFVFSCVQAAAQQ